MRSTAKIISALTLLTGLGVCALWLVAGVTGMVPPDGAWNAVMLVGLPIAAIGAMGTVLTGQLRDSYRHIFKQ